MRKNLASHGPENESFHLEKIFSIYYAPEVTDFHDIIWLSSQ
jgi:hypothetical protein